MQSPSAKHLVYEKNLLTALDEQLKREKVLWISVLGSFGLLQVS